MLIHLIQEIVESFYLTEPVVAEHIVTDNLFIN